jgi:2,4'-dihydroxyacetophenone dioxygenase
MEQTSMSTIDRLIAAALERSGLPDWIPEGEGKWSLPIAFLPGGAGWVELMRLRPGVRVGLHRHTGEVHALNLQGARRLNDGRLVSLGEYVYEPPGNPDWWQAEGAGEVIVHVVVKGAVEYLAAHRQVIAHIETRDRIADYHRHCAAMRVTPRDLECPGPRVPLASTAVA